MKRQDKYPETRTFHFYNANPKGRITSDCTYRAISTALGQSWEDTVIEMAQHAVLTGYSPNDSKGIDKYLESKGWVKHAQPRKANNTKYTGAEFVKWFKGTCVANLGGNHVVCIKDGKVWDHWDSTYGCIGNYWTKEE